MTTAPTDRRRTRALDVLVVDDSALMRRYLRQTLEEAGHSVRVARDGQDALDRVVERPPDVVTLDINMPQMDGLTCLANIMELAPVPVVMVSSLTEHGALATFEALELGAVDYISKPGGTVSHNILKVKELLLAKVEGAARARLRRRPRLSHEATAPREPVPARGSRVAPPCTPAPPPSRPSRLSSSRASPAAVQAPLPLTPAARPAPSGSCSVELVVVGVSTGGPGALEAIFSQLPADFPAPIVVAQHMPENFTRVFAERLARLCALEVLEVSKVEVLQPGTIYIARGGHDIVIERRLRRLVAVSTPVDSTLIWHPSVSRLVASAIATVSPERLIGVQLTGMGDDGAREMAELKKRGGRTIAEAEESCVVYGMPRALVVRNGATAVLHRDAMAGRLGLWLARSPAPSASSSSSSSSSLSGAARPA